MSPLKHPAEAERPRVLFITGNPEDGHAWLQVLRAQHFAVEVESTVTEGTAPVGAGHAAWIVVGERNLLAACATLSKQQATIPILGIIGPLNRARRQELLAAGAADLMMNDADAFEFVARVRALVLRNTAIRTLIIEDDARIAAGLRLILEAAGHACRIAATLREAHDLFSHGPTDLLLIDRGLPDGDAITFLARIREKGALTPALIVTARNETHQRVEGLRFGADDYIGKPFDEDELLARIEVLLRPRQRDGRLSFGPLEILRRDGIARWRGERIPLTDKEFRLLCFLAERHGLTIPVSMLRADVWETVRQHTETNIVAAGVRRLRRALEGAGLPEIIVTEETGYRFDPRPLLEIGDAA